MVRRGSALVWLVALGLGLGGCGERSDAAEDSDAPTCVPWLSNCHECLSVPELPVRAIDILVVVDGGAGSQGAQARLAAGLDALVATLESSAVPIDYRIAVTTTDMGPPACDPASTTPERGELVASSCRERLGEFVDAQDQDHSALCSDRCSYENLDFLAHPWVERDGEQIELPEGVDPAEVVRCLAMSGVRSCGFESPLAAVEAALLGSATPGHPNAGFFRFEARRAFVVVSDAFDCSWSDAGLAIFDPEGARAFWSDPLADTPTPAVCWNAGTACESFDGVMSCEIGFYDASGTPNGFPSKYVLRHPDELTDWVDSGLWGHDELLFFIGVPVEGVDALAYPQADDPEFALEHGIGPGCEGPEGTVALPPVRMLRFLRAKDLFHGDPNDYAKSICSPDFTPEFNELGARVLERLTHPNCFIGSAAICDLDPTTPLLDVECELTGYPFTGGEEQPLAECARGPDGAYLVDFETGRPAMPEIGVELCYLIENDPQGYTEDPLDDRDSGCGITKVSFEIITLDGRSPNLWVSAKCMESAED